MWFLFPYVLLASAASFLLKIKSHQTFDLYQKMTVGDFEGNEQSWYAEIYSYAFFFVNGKSAILNQTPCFRM